MALGINDLDAFGMLRSMIIRELNGDDKREGLGRAILSSQSWDAFNQTKGLINGYENVLGWMQEVVRRIHEQEGSDRPTHARGMN